MGVIGNTEEMIIPTATPRKWPNDFLNVYYLHCAFSCSDESGGSADPSGSGSHTKALRRLVDDDTGGDDTSALHQSFNFTFAEKFGSSSRSLRANVVHITLPQPQGRPRWRGDAPWVPVVRTPALLQICGPSQSSSAAWSRGASRFWLGGLVSVDVPAAQLRNAVVSLPGLAWARPMPLRHASFVGLLGLTRGCPTPCCRLGSSSACACLRRCCPPCSFASSESVHSGLTRCGVFLAMLSSDLLGRPQRRCKHRVHRTDHD